ncbi:hypothetical protein RRG08_022348 [Elysia crispata]|uniref:Uncharacterized protein n=1 Tax=Elysia crispata TaxID=231223 RepID=A0AAE0Z1G4_9GAST|nr:hypothetical protein RRG08_022348 [Elysia crispata]
MVQKTPAGGETMLSHSLTPGFRNLQLVFKSILKPQSRSFHCYIKFIIMSFRVNVNLGTSGKVRPLFDPVVETPEKKMANNFQALAARMCGIKTVAQTWACNDICSLPDGTGRIGAHKRPRSRLASIIWLGMRRRLLRLTGDRSRA